VGVDKAVGTGARETLLNSQLPILPVFSLWRTGREVIDGLPVLPDLQRARRRGEHIDCTVALAAGAARCVAELLRLIRTCAPAARVGKELSAITR
jgi:hypothetical protein